MVIPPLPLFHCPLFLLFTCHCTQSQASTCQYVEKWWQGTTGPHSPKSMERTNRPEIGHTLTSPHLTSTLLPFDWGSSSCQKIPQYPDKGSFFNWTPSPSRGGLFFPELSFPSLHCEIINAAPLKRMKQLGRVQRGDLRETLSLPPRKALLNLVGLETSIFKIRGKIILYSYLSF